MDQPRAEQIMRLEYRLRVLKMRRGHTAERAASVTDELRLIDNEITEATEKHRALLQAHACAIGTCAT